MLRNSIEQITCSRFDLVQRTWISRVMLCITDVKTIMSVRSSCGPSGRKGEVGCVSEMTHDFCSGTDRSTSSWPSRVSRRTAVTGLVFGAPSLPASSFLLPSPHDLWSVSNLQHGSLMDRRNLWPWIYNVAALIPGAYYEHLGAANNERILIHPRGHHWVVFPSHKMSLFSFIK